MRKLRMIDCPYCGQEFDLMKSCICVCPHEKPSQIAVCDDCVAKAMKGLKPLKALNPMAGQRSSTGPKFTNAEKRGLNQVLKEKS